ncbi:MAG: phosphotriesterase-related protein [Chloroflexi bacterium]|nr:phosphotriesterase-related protein [Chloroflexota bacterium]
MSDTRGKVMTVLGPIAPEALGTTLIHEHILFDLSVYHEQRFGPGKAEPLPDEPLGIQHLHILKHNIARLRDNVFQKDVETAATELDQFKALGGSTVVEVSSGGLMPDPAGLVQLAQWTGLNIVAGTGYYIGASHPADLASKSVEQVTDEMLRDVLEGIPGTGVRAGILGEIGTTEPLSRTERIVLEATGRVQAQTGTAIVLHPDSFHRTYSQITPNLDILEQAGADLSRVIVSHCDDRLHQHVESYRKLAARGCTLAFDTFGKQAYYPTRKRQYPNDDQRIATIARLVDDGLAGSVTLAHDVCYKTDLTRWGGDGYGHILRNIVPRLRETGVPDTAIQQMLVENPRRLLTLTR